MSSLQRSSRPCASSARQQTTLQEVSGAFLASRQVYAHAPSLPAMIFLRDNTLLERDITADDIKPRLLGHWGTCPGLSLVYAHTNRLIRKTKQSCLYVVGPGHGAPAILACLWLEGSLGTFLPKYTRDRQGLRNLITSFSVPGGFPRCVSVYCSPERN